MSSPERASLIALRRDLTLVTVARLIELDPGVCAASLNAKPTSDSEQQSIGKRTSLS